MVQSGGKIVETTRQGFLMKKGHRIHNWKARKSVLHKGACGLLYYQGSKLIRANERNWRLFVLTRNGNSSIRVVTLVRVWFCGRLWQ
ncbi:uncharacterized protein LOC134198147 isoform X2 [Corticium candelabrum]|nr:uncharacterized protein LOC134198147 isoform X2 [Corticium candelabrum]